jgi:hypothetical protein
VLLGNLVSEQHRFRPISFEFKAELRYILILKMMMTQYLPKHCLQWKVEVLSRVGLPNACRVGSNVWPLFVLVPNLQNPRAASLFIRRFPLQLPSDYSK